MEIKTLNGEWQFRRVGEERAYPAQVPSTVCGDLLANGLLEDPYYRDNEAKTLAALRANYEYFRQFIVEEPLLAHDRVEMVFHGLDTFATVRINGAAVLEADDMHRTWTLDVKPLLKPGQNQISILFDSPTERAEALHAASPVYHTSDTVSGFEQVRKAHSMYGWDWGPQLPDMGIFRDIELRAWNTARIRDCYVRQTHQNGAVELTLETELEKCSGVSVVLESLLYGPDGALAGRCQWEGTADTASLTFAVKNPRLWWPNGYGEQPLYKLVLKLADAVELEEKTLQIGLRTLTVNTQPDQWGEKFEVCVNGISIFAMGANYIPEDSILTRVTPERTENLLRQCVMANYNMVRVWGGGYFQNDDFYDSCDRLGLLVWQDLLFACAVYRLNDRFVENIVAETRDNVLRLRNHACIALWCGNNELEWGWSGWDMGFGNDPRNRADYIKQFEWILPQTVRKCDPDRFYWLASPSSGGSFDDPNDQNRGDVHYWEVWHRLKPFTEYRKYYFRFCSEFGFQSFPGMKTVESFTLPEDRNVFSDVMECHQKNGTANGRILMYLADNFLYPAKLETLLYASQVLQAEAIRYGVEHWRANRGRCMGALYWQVNDCWPVASWSSIDYFNRWKPLHYYAKKFYAPLLCCAVEENGAVAFKLSSELQQTTSCVLRWQLRSTNGEILSAGETETQAAPLAVTSVCEADFSPWLQEKSQKSTIYLSYQLEYGGQQISETHLFVKPKRFAFEDSEITVEACLEEQLVLTVRAGRYAKYVWLDSPEFDCVFSDNCFDLLPGEEKRITLLSQERPITVEEAASIQAVSAYDIR